MSAVASVVFVTGASRGVGLAVAQALLDQGHLVATFSRSVTPELKGLEERYQSSLLLLQGDLADTDAAEDAVEKTCAHFGRLDAVVLNAAVEVLGRIQGGKLSDWRHTFEVNLFSMIAQLQVAIPYLRDSAEKGTGGRIILVSSVGGHVPAVGLAAYCASKAAVDSLARSLQMEEPTIPTVAIHPGLVDTFMVRQVINDNSGVCSDELVGIFKRGVSAPPGAVGPVIAVPAEKPGGRLAWLALHCPMSLSGQYFDWNAPEIEALL